MIDVVGWLLAVWDFLFYNNRIFLIPLVAIAGLLMFDALLPGRLPHPDGEQ